MTEDPPADTTEDGPPAEDTEATAAEAAASDPTADGATEASDRRQSATDTDGRPGSGTTPEERPDGGGQPADGDGTLAPVSEDGDTGTKLVTVVEYAAFGILCLLALVATFRFYFAASEAIRVWFSSDFVPVFQAAFNLVVLVLAALGISVLVRRIG